MQDQDKIVYELDDNYKGRKGIKEMIDRMMNTAEGGKLDAHSKEDIKKMEEPLNKKKEKQLKGKETTGKKIIA
ncbi:MAG: hypothetical protein J1E40_03835 [Oscillospiraceae bacterium]|nr:hypothetical protein [Oscillospiraceae bacterium]